MAINIVERAIAPYNNPTNRIRNKEQYSLFAPAANVNRVGMAGYSPEYFAVRDQIVELSMAFLGTILQNKVWDGGSANGLKEPNIIYSNFATQVVERKNSDGSVSLANMTGSLLVVRTNDVSVSQANTEILIAHNKLYLRKVTVDTEGIVRAGRFEPIYNKHVTSDQLAYRAVASNHLQLETVGEEHLKNSAVTTNKIGTAAVTTDKIKAGAIETEKIANEAVTEDKLSNSFKARIVSLEEDAFTDVEYFPTNGELRFHTTNGEIKSIDLPLELIVSGGRYDEDGQSIVLTLANGDEIVIPLSDFVENTITQIENRLDNIERDFSILEDDVDNLSIFDDAPMIGSDRAVTSDGIATEFQRFSTAYDKIIQDADASVMGTLRSDITETANELYGKIDEVASIAKGAAQSLPFSSYSEMITEINVLPKDALKVGDHVYIRTVKVPDLWVYAINPNNVPYEYTTDEVFVNELAQNIGVQVGYFILAPLETQKVDLTDYAKKSQVPVINATLKENGAYTITITMGVE